MDTMLNIIHVNLEEKNITFDPDNQRVRCLAHIIDLAAKKALEDLRASGPDDETDIMEDTEETEEDLKSIMYKVGLCNFSTIHNLPLIISNLAPQINSQDSFLATTP